MQEDLAGVSDGGDITESAAPSQPPGIIYGTTGRGFVSSAPFMKTRTIVDEAITAALGYAMPAEWERHEATWLGWPHNPTDWPDKIDTIRWVYGEMVRKISPGEMVRILVRHARRGEAGAPLPEPRRGAI